MLFSNSKFDTNNKKYFAYCFNSRIAPYTYYRYTNRVKRQVPVYKVRNNYNYSETTSYKLSVDGLGTYTSSLPYNTSNVYSEEYGPVLDRQ